MLGSQQDDEWKRKRREQFRRMPSPGIRHDLVCADCGKQMALRVGVYGKFYGCVGYPSCKGALTAKTDGSPCGTPGNQVTRAARTAVVRKLKGVKATVGEHYPEWTKRIAHRASLEGINVGSCTAEECTRLSEAIDAIMHAATVQDAFSRLLQDDPLDNLPGIPRSSNDGYFEGTWKGSSYGDL